MSEQTNHTEVSVVRRGLAGTGGRTSHNERYDYAPVTYPQIGQNTFICKQDGNLVFDLAAHDAFHDEIETAFEVPSPSGFSDKITEPLPRSEKTVSEIVDQSVKVRGTRKATEAE